MCDGSASDAFRVMKELHQLLIAEKLYDDAKEYWTKVFNKHGEKSSWEGMLHLKLVIMRCRHYRQGDFCCALPCDIGCSVFFPPNVYFCSHSARFAIIAVQLLIVRKVFAVLYAHSLRLTTNVGKS